MSSIKMKKQKAAEVSKLSSQIAKGSQDQRFSEYAGAFISPKTTGPVIFPSITPSRAGAALFPLVIEVDSPTDFGIIIKPDLGQPLSIASGEARAESADPIYGSFQAVSTVRAVTSMNLESPCPVHGVEIAGESAIPLISTVGATLSLTLFHENSTGSQPIDIQWRAYSGGAWLPLGTPVSVPRGVTTSLSGVFYIASTHIGFEVIPRPAESKAQASKFTFSITPTAGIMTCAPAGAIGTLSVFQPDWSTVLGASQRVSVVAADCLVTYEGSTLNNGGSISVCNTDDELLIKDSFYETIASRPHDMYRGRLASEGETEGGAHWHYIPDDPLQLLMQDQDALIQDSRQVPYGYVGVKGKSAGEVVRIECHFMLNFYSLDPSFAMDIQPPFKNFNTLLYALRDRVPLVSSNDSHLGKILKLFRKGGARGLDMARSGLQLSQDHNGEIARAISILSTMF